MTITLKHQRNIYKKFIVILVALVLVLVLVVPVPLVAPSKA
jgi:uncharacterized protein YpmS